MKIKSIIIEKFGIFKDLEITNLSSKQINLLCENNEFGKTTLFEFIRRCLYGFDVGVDYGGECKGKLILFDSENNELIIDRAKKSVKKDKLKVYFKGKEFIDKEAEALLSKILPVNGNVFKNVYAFSLDELQQIGLLDDEDIKIKIFGAGQGVSSSINKTLKNLGNDIDSLFKLRGKNQKINQQLKELDNIEKLIRNASISVKDYDLRSAELNELKESINEEQNKLKQLTNQHKGLEQQQKIMGLIFELKQILRKRDELGDSEEKLESEKISQRDIAEVENILLQLTENKVKLKNLNLDLDNLLHKKDKVPFSKVILADFNSDLMNEDIMFLQQQYMLLKERQIQIVAERCELRDSFARLSHNCGEINKNWSLSTLKSIKINNEICEKYYRLRDNLNKKNQVYESAENNWMNLNNSLYFNFDNEVVNNCHKFKTKDSLNLFLIIVFSAVIGTGVNYFIQKFWISSLVSAILTIIAIIVAKPYKKLITKKFVSQKQNEICEKLTQSKRDKEIVELEWENFLYDFHITKYMNINNFENEVLKPLKNCQRVLQQLLDQRHSLNNKKNSFFANKKIFSDLLLRYYLRYQKHLDIENYKNLKILERQNFNIDYYDIYHKKLKVFFVQLNGVAEQKIEIDSAIGKLELDIVKNSSYIDEQQLKLRKIYKKFLVDNFDALKALFDKQEQKEKFESDINNLVTNIQRNLNLSCSLNEILDNYGELDDGKINEQLVQITEQINFINKNYREQLQQYGVMEQELLAFANDSDIQKLMVAKEKLKSELKNNIKEWAAKKLAFKAIENALETFQQCHQPEVINSAKKYFYQLIGDDQRNLEYSFVEKKLKAQPSKIVNNSFHSQEYMLDVSQMSRGAKEQLFLAIRLALIEKYRCDGYKMPIIMDDILVNFDKNRRNNAVKVLIKFARDNDLQLIFMSCNKNMIDYFKHQVAQLNEQKNEYAFEHILLR